ncbi:MAG: bifunctional 4-hydroxy-2-oxoglutarate aldolase/2-dehydro-3-deoxy-phosphogluconate aldolase [Spirochaetaceae bacterium]|nr:bifunctional 4-hydroxy-2-oxoglutarate aldolase/2-dehydro-3-deoxy-phosphogluconate aldolase [Spirochaetaceae bacterium]
MSITEEKLQRFGIIPVVCIDDAEKALPLGLRLRDAGLACAEITFRTGAAEAAMVKIHEALPDMLIGAGTVTNTTQVDKAIAAGASFAVSAGFNPRVVRYAQDKGLPFFPGVMTPGEIEGAMELGCNILKFFPAEQAGGLAMLKAFAGPYSSLRFIPTGGISLKNLKEYLSYEKVLACGGSWMVPQDKINTGDFDAISILVKEAVNAVKAARGKWVECLV